MVEIRNPNLEIRNKSEILNSNHQTHFVLNFLLRISSLFRISKFVFRISISYLLASFAIAVFVAITLANDEVTVRSKDKPYKGPIKNETSRSIEMTGIKAPIPAEDIVDILYDVNPVDVRINVYRPAVKSEKDYNDPDPKKESQRKANLADALKKYVEAHQKVKEKSAKRHLEYKLAVLTARQALDENGDLAPAIKRLSDFKAKHANSWQITACLELLGRLQTETKQYKDAEETYLELAQADVPDDTRQEAELLAAQVSAKAGKQEVALKKLQALEAKLPKDSKYRGRAKIGQAECLAAAKKEAAAIALLRQLAKETTDKNLKALAYNALGQCYYNGEQLKEARWEFLWVDVVYNQDKAEHAKALYYLAKTFDRLGEKERAQECREALMSDRSFAGMEWQAPSIEGSPQGEELNCQDSFQQHFIDPPAKTDLPIDRHDGHAAPITGNKVRHSVHVDLFQGEAASLLVGGQDVPGVRAKVTVLASVHEEMQIGPLRGPLRPFFQKRKHRR